MNVIWPISSLYAGLLAVWAYYKIGRLYSQRAVSEAKASNEKPQGKSKPFWQMVTFGSSQLRRGLLARRHRGQMMLAGLLTSYPVNWWLLSAGLKRKM